MASRLAPPAVYGFQPQTTPRIAKSSLTAGLVDCFSMVNGLFVSVQPNELIASASGLVADTGTPGRSFSKFGAGKSFNGSSSYSMRSSVPTGTFALNPNEMTMLAVMQVGSNISYSGGAQSFFGYGGTNANTRYYIGGLLNDGALGFNVTDDGSTSQATSGVPAPSLVASSSNGVLIGVRSVAQNFHAAYWNGFQTTTATATTMGTSTFSRAALGMVYVNGASRFANGSVFMAAAWNRALTRAEIAALSANPWQIFEAPSRPIILNSVAGGFDRTATAAVTLAGVSRSATGALTIKANGSNTLAGVTRSATGTLTIKASASQALAAITRVATGTLTIKGAVSATLGAVVQVGTGKLIIKASNSTTLAAILQTATGTISSAFDRNATAVQTLTGMTSISTGKLIITGQQ